MMEIVAKYNIPIVRVKNDKQLVYCAVRFLELANDGKKIEVLAKRKGKTEVDRKIIGLAEILNLGIGTVRKIYDAGAIDAVIAFDEERLKGIKGIGKKTIEKIIRVI